MKAETLVEKMNKFVVISGYSGGGKSILLTELSREGYKVVPEVARGIVKEQLAINGAEDRLRPSI